MKLLELEITNVRGIRHLLLFPNGDNFIVWGPNGSGKSAVVDAIDFLLTGKISRLTGKGTGNITLSQHGPHIDCTPEDAVVRAIVQIPGYSEPIEIKRCMAKSNQLEMNDDLESVLQPTLSMGSRGQHVLTRREILKYITAEGSTRAQEIQDLLNISEIENIRKSFVKIRNELRKEYQATSRGVSTAEGAVNATMQTGKFQTAIVLQAVNQSRALLGASPIKNLGSQTLKAEVALPSAITGKQPINVTLLEGDVNNISKVASDKNLQEISKIDRELRITLQEVRSNPELSKALSQRELLNLGLQLIDESGNCPLCDTNWPDGELNKYLKAKLQKAREGEIFHHKLTKLTKDIKGRIDIVLASLGKLLATAEIIGENEAVQVLQTWTENLQALNTALSSPIEKFLNSRYPESLVERLLAPSNLTDITARILVGVKSKFPEATPEQTAWDKLTRLEENLKSLEKAQILFEAASISYQRAEKLLNNFEHARDKILKNLYNDIRNRFVSLYKALHGSDESNFEARIESDGAALNIEVDFHGRGTNPPHALHSEGHQDSMGVCLYLALAERLTGGLIDLIILDDVVMSVDADHRRELCRLLAASFPNRQFLITTHDKNWANQLKSEGVVTSKGSVEFYNWNIETGPHVNNETDLWERLKTDLENNDISSAAARLRRGSESYFAAVCDALQAPVKFKLNSRWELGDFLPAAIGQYRKLVKKGKSACQSWGDTEGVNNLNELDSMIGQVYSRTNAEQWAVNANVHYNNWVNFTPHDFEPVLNTFQDLYYLFLCGQCSGMLFVSTNGMEQVSLRCNCGKVNWNLVEKKKQ